MTSESKVECVEYGKKYCGVPHEINTDVKGYQQPWSGYKPESVKGKELLIAQEANIKNDSLYARIEVGYNQWMQLACEQALLSVKNGGGPFGAVIVQVDDESGDVLRYWCANNSVTQCCDPTAHAEVNAIRAACHDLGVFDLGAIAKKSAKLNQDGAVSHCEIYSSTEPCPMCYSAISWARIPVLVFASTRFDAAVPGVEFSDQDLYDELAVGYSERAMVVRQASCPNSLDAFNLWKASDVIKY